ncbi:MAG: site-2 protease family protein [Clostridia bacterium]|nr:site-2 protease family protein [Clostridia bacterium]
MVSNLLSFSSVLKYGGYILIAILVLLFMVLIHELGHYIAGKILKFKINEFSIGFGPKIFQKKNKSGELISLRVFPLGGYCAFEGETEESKDNPQAFNNQKPWKRLIVLFCGAFFNFLSAIIFSFILLMSSGYDLVQVKTVAPTSINYGYFQTGDVIYGVNDTKIDFVEDKYFSSLVTVYLEENYDEYVGDITQESNTFTKDSKTYYLVERPIKFNVIRGDREMSVHGYVNAIYNDKGEYTSGWSLFTTYSENDEEFNAENYKYSFTESLTQAVPFTCKWVWKVLVVFGQLITGKLAITSLGGPVTTVTMIANFTQQNMLLLLLPLIAVNLAVFNLLPIPALDGFQMIFTAIEWIRKKPIKREIINTINNVGLIVLFGFVILVDILQFVL